MPAPRSKYREAVPWSRATVEAALVADDPEKLLQAVVAVSMHEEDQKYAEELCVRLSRHPHFNVRGNAVLGFGHIARVHGKLEKKTVQPIIAAALKDQDEYVRGQAYSAKDDTEHFLRWKYEKA
jgi:hypothetical protein